MPQGQLSAVFSLMGGILLFVLVLFLAWYCTRWIGKRCNAPHTSGEIEVLERTPIGTDRMLVIIRVCGKVWLLGVTSQQISLICELDAGYFQQVHTQTKPFGAASVSTGVKDFSKAFQDTLHRWAPEKKQKRDQENGQD